MSSLLSSKSLLPCCGDTAALQSPFLFPSQLCGSNSPHSSITKDQRVISPIATSLQAEKNDSSSTISRLRQYCRPAEPARTSSSPSSSVADSSSSYYVPPPSVALLERLNASPSVCGIPLGRLDQSAYSTVPYEREEDGRGVGGGGGGGGGKKKGRRKEGHEKRKAIDDFFARINNEEAWNKLDIHRYEQSGLSFQPHSHPYPFNLNDRHVQVKRRFPQTFSDLFQDFPSDIISSSSDRDEDIGTSDEWGVSKSPSCLPKSHINVMVLLWEAFEICKMDNSGWVSTRDIAWTLKRDARVQQIFGLWRAVVWNSDDDSEEAEDKEEEEERSKREIYEKEVYEQQEELEKNSSLKDQQKTSKLLGWLWELLRNKDEPPELDDHSQMKLRFLLTQIRYIEAKLIQNERCSSTPRITFNTFYEYFYPFIGCEDISVWKQIVDKNKQDNREFNRWKPSSFCELSIEQLFSRDALLGHHVEPSALHLPNRVCLPRLSVVEGPDSSVAPRRDHEAEKRLQKERERVEGVKSTPTEMRIENLLKTERALAEHSLLSVRLANHEEDVFFKSPEEKFRVNNRSCIVYDLEPPIYDKADVLPYDEEFFENIDNVDSPSQQSLDDYDYETWLNYVP